MKNSQFGVFVFLLCTIIVGEIGTSLDSDPASVFGNLMLAIFSGLSGLALAYSVVSWLEENRKPWDWLLKEKKT